MMRNNLLNVLAAIAATIAVPMAYGQSTQSSPLKTAQVAHLQNGTVEVDARSARPLHQALTAIRNEYGWLIDYEDPVYDFTQEVDDTDPKWRQAHPDAPSVHRPAGGDFAFSGKEPASGDVENGQGITPFLAHVLATYNASGNPGRFTLIEQANKRIAVVGVLNGGEAGIFGYKGPPPRGYSTPAERLNAVLASVSSQIGIRVIYSFGANNPLNRPVPEGELGTQPAAARLWIANILDSTQHNLVYEALYDMDANTVFVNTLPATKITATVLGPKIEFLRQR